MTAKKASAAPKHIPLTKVERDLWDKVAFQAFCAGNITDAGMFANTFIFDRRKAFAK